MDYTPPSAREGHRTTTVATLRHLVGLRRRACRLTTRYHSFEQLLPEHANSEVSV